MPVNIEGQMLFELLCNTNTIIYIIIYNIIIIMRLIIIIIITAVT